MENVAALSAAAVCEGASSGQDTCSFALDGGLLDWDQAWVIEQQDPVGAWIDIRFSGQYDIMGGRIMQRLNQVQQIEMVKLDFGNGNIKQVG